MSNDNLMDLERLEARGRWLRRGALLLACGAAVAAGLVAWQFWLSDDDGVSQEVQTVPVERATIRATIAASGTAEAADETELRFATLGRVEEILVSLGQEVKGDDPLAVLETDDLERRLATAEANLSLAQIRLRQILKGADEADLLAAEQTIATAQASLSKAQRDLDKLVEGASESELATAEQAVASAESALASAEAKLYTLIESPSPAELAAAEAAVDNAEQAVASAQANLESARAKRKQLQDSPSQAEVASAEAALASARANVSTAENLVDSSEASLDSAEGDLRSAGDAYCDAIDTLNRTDPLCPFSQVPLDQASVDRLLAALNDPSTDEEVYDCPEGIPEAFCPTLRDLIQALLDANTAYVSAENNVENARLNLEATQAAQVSAQANLDALADLPAPEDLQAAEAAVTAAEEALEAAQANLISAETQLGELSPSVEDIGAARAAVDSAEETLEAAEAQLQELREGADAGDIRAAQDAVRSAEATLSTAMANRDEILRGADPDDVDMQQQQVRLAEISVDEAQKALDEATLKAPYDGTVAGIGIQVGDLVSSSSQLSAVTLLTPGALKVNLAVGETDLPSLKPGMVGLILFDALQEQTFPVVITAIGLAPEVEGGIVTYMVEGALIGVGQDTASGSDGAADGSATAATAADSPDRPAPGMNGSAVIVTEEHRDALVVPNRAIRSRGDETVVEMIVDGKSEIRAIETGLSDTENTEVLSGLEEGDQVVVPGTAQAAEEGEEEDLPEGIR